MNGEILSWLTRKLERTVVRAVGVLLPLIILGSMYTAFLFGWVRDLPREVYHSISLEAASKLSLEITLLLSAAAFFTRSALFLINQTHVLVKGRDLDAFAFEKLTEKILYSMVVSTPSAVVLFMFVGLYQSIHLIIALLFILSFALLAVLNLEGYFQSTRELPTARKPRLTQVTEISNLREHFSNGPYLVGKPHRQIMLAMLVILMTYQIGWSRQKFLQRTEPVEITFSEGTKVDGQIIMQSSQGVLVRKADDDTYRFIPLQSIREISY